MSFHHSIQAVCSFTGLKEPFIRRVIRECPFAFDRHSTRGDNNSILFMDTAMPVFDRVKQLKEEGRNLQEISRVLQDELSHSNSLSEPVLSQHPQMIGTESRWFDEVCKAHEKAMQAKEESLHAHEELIRSMKQQMLLLSDYRTPEQILQDRENYRKKNEEETEKRMKRIKIIGQIRALEGKIFVSAQRSKLLDQLEELC